MHKRTLLVVPALVALAAPARAQCEIQDQIALGLGAPDRFGTSVVVRGDIAIIGAPQMISSKSGPLGYAQVYRRVGGNWTPSQILLPTDFQFGQAVDFDGVRIAVGAPGLVSGRAEIYTFDGFEWVREQTVAIPGIGFGGGISIRGDWLAVGAPKVVSGFPEVFVYQRQAAGNWVLNDHYTGPVGSPFGKALAMGRGTLFIGNPRDGGGTVDVYQLRGAQWLLKQRLTSSNPAACEFGWDVALHRGTLAVTERCGDSVQFFQQVGEDWVETDSVTLPPSGAAILTQPVVDVFGDAAVVGVVEPGVIGRVFRLRRERGSWSVVGELCSGSATGSLTGFGTSVSIDKHILVGNPPFLAKGGAFFYSKNGDVSEPGPVSPLDE